jgi:hypothetical protein
VYANSIAIFSMQVDCLTPFRSSRARWCDDSVKSVQRKKFEPLVQHSKLIIPVIEKVLLLARHCSRLKQEVAKNASADLIKYRIFSRRAVASTDILLPARIAGIALFGLVLICSLAVFGVGVLWKTLSRSALFLLCLLVLVLVAALRTTFFGIQMQGTDILSIRPLVNRICVLAQSILVGILCYAWGCALIEMIEIASARLASFVLCLALALVIGVPTVYGVVMAVLIFREIYVFDLSLILLAAVQVVLILSLDGFVLFAFGRVNSLDYKNSTDQVRLTRLKWMLVFVSLLLILATVRLVAILVDAYIILPNLLLLVLGTLVPDGITLVVILFALFLVFKPAVKVTVQHESNALKVPLQYTV